MIQSEVLALWQQPDTTQYAALNFLARYRGDTLRAYSQDLRYFLRWCAERSVEPLQANGRTSSCTCAGWNSRA